MKKLTNNQKKFLRARGHTLKSIVMVGQHGLSEAVLLASIRNALALVYWRMTEKVTIEEKI
jgi:RNA-binding protein YhbY